MDVLAQLQALLDALTRWAMAQSPTFWIGMAAVLLIYLTVGCVLATRWFSHANKHSEIDFHDADGGAVLAFICLAILVFVAFVLFWPIVVAVRFLIRLGQTLAKDIP